MRKLPVIAALAVLVFSGLVHGLWTDRWGRPAALEDALARVERVPLSFGPWQGRPLDSDQDSFERTGAQAYWVRQYTNAHTKRSVSVILMCGRAGRMAVHTPQVCYSGAGFDMLRPPAQYPVAFDGKQGRLWTARFAKPNTPGSELRLCWAWNARGVWEAPSSPRWSFRGEPFLYKLYVIEEGAAYSSNAAAQADVLADFLPHLFVVLQSSLFSDHLTAGLPFPRPLPPT